MNQSRNEATGMPCPRCQFNIKFNLQELLTKSTISCPGCLLELDMEIPTEIKQHLQEIQLAQDMVEQARKVNK